VNTHHARRVYFEQLKRVVPLTMVLAHYGVELRKQGQQLVGSCPIHRGSNKRQFTVRPATSEWHCFGDCKRGGAMLEFVAAMENVEVIEAARLVARWFAIDTGSEPHSQHHRKQQRSRAMSGEKPSHKVFVVEGEGDNAFWHRAGSAWPHKDGKGLNMQIPTGMSLSGRVVLREFTEDDAKEEDNRAKRKK
jgi:CHC2 zinc finger